MTYCSLVYLSQTRSGVDKVGGGSFVVYTFTSVEPIKSTLIRGYTLVYLVGSGDVCFSS